MIAWLRRGALALTVAAALAATCAGWAGAEGLLSDQTVSGAAAGGPALAMAPNGYLAAAWEQPLAGGQFAVGVATRAPGGDWSRPQLLGSGSNDKFQLSVAVDDAGDTAVAWEEVVSPNALSFVASRAAGGAFTAAQQLTDAASVSSPVVGVDGVGRVTVLYEPFPALVVRDFQAGASALAATPRTLSDGRSSACFGGSLLAVAPSGDAVGAALCGGALFALRQAGAWNVSPVVASTFNGCPGAPTVINSPTAVAIDAQGHAAGLLTNRVVQYTGFDTISCLTFPPTETDTLHLVLPVGGFMTPLVGEVASARATSFTAPLGGAAVGVSPGGPLTAWTATDGSAMRLNVRDFAFDGTPAGAAQPLDPTANVLSPQVAVGADGRALVAWERNPGSATPLPIELATRPPGGAGFGAPREVTPTGSQSGAFATALDASADGAVAYLDDATRFAHVRGFDAGVPVLSGVSIPSSARAGLPPAAFAASASDVWGPVSLSWSFGDGSSAGGGAATHVYMSAGTFTATVTATDAAGNASSRSGRVTVASAVSGTLRITSASLTHRTFRVGRNSTPLTGATASRRAPVGTTFRFGLEVPRISAPFALAVPPGVRIAIGHAAAGRLAGGRCVKPTRRLARHRRCTRRIVDGTLRRRARGGANAVAFSGRVGRKALAPGRYMATLTPSWGARTAAPRALRFTVVR